ncbi:MAG: ABC transporter permease [Bacilli bacterium]|nr:ABC transporter permease [Bacilli bacterium]
MKNIITIIKKELKRFFTDRRMLISLIMPGLLIFVIYSLMGSFMSDAMDVEDNYVYNVYVENLPEEYNVILENEEYIINIIEENNTIDEIKTKIEEKEVDLYLGFDEDFINKVNQGLKPNVTIYYNSSSNESLELYSYLYTTLSVGSTTIDYNYLVNMNPDINYNLATNEDISAQVITMMLPYLLIILLFTGCVSLATESIAGEKERGTIYTLLVTPTKRSHIAIGKIVALSITALVAASTTFVGLIASLPNLIEGAGGEITLSMYSIETFIGVFGVILVTVMLFTTLLSIISTIAKNIKEASQWSSVLMVVVMLMGVSSLVGMGNIPTNPIVYLIPVYNSVHCMSSLFALQFNGINFIITILSNIVYIGVGVYVLAKMFNSEKIMSN